KQYHKKGILFHFSSIFLVKIYYSHREAISFFSCITPMISDAREPSRITQGASFLVLLIGRVV
ncbi:MAG: hypothetical protein ACYC2T_06365, partial [Bacillota bacterium]